MISFSFFFLVLLISLVHKAKYDIYHIYIYISFFLSHYFLKLYYYYDPLRSHLLFFVFFIIFIYFVIAAPLHSRHFPSTIPFCFCFSLIYYNQYSLWFFFVLPSSSFSRLSHRAYFHVSSLL